MQRLTLELGSTTDKTGVVTRLADLQERIAQAERRLARVRDQLQSAGRTLLDEQEVARSLALFEPVWEALTPHERGEVLQLLVERVDYDGKTGQVAITFQAGGVQALADQLARHHEEVCA